jgi:hypothetical protein
VGEDVATDVEQHHEVATEVRGGVREARRDRCRTRVRIQQEGRLAEQLGDAALREAEAAGPGGARARERDGVVEPPRAGELVEPAGSREGVDGAALPGQAAEDGGRAVCGGEAGDAQGADDVTAAADARDQDALRV